MWGRRRRFCFAAIIFFLFSWYCSSVPPSAAPPHRPASVHTRPPRRRATGNWGPQGNLGQIANTQVQIQKYTPARSSALHWESTRRPTSLSAPLHPTAFQRQPSNRQAIDGSAGRTARLAGAAPGAAFGPPPRHSVNAHRECSMSPCRIRCSMSPRRRTVWSPRLRSSAWPDSGPMNLKQKGGHARRMGGEWVCEPTRADGHTAKAGRTHKWEEWVQRRLVCGSRGGARGKRLRSGEIGRGNGKVALC